MLGTEPDQPQSLSPACDRNLFLLRGWRRDAHTRSDGRSDSRVFVVHPPGELHEYENGLQRTILFRVRYGDDMGTRFLDWRGNAEWKQTPDDAEYFRHNA